jgi:TorA maturation chaperone TorD
MSVEPRKAGSPLPAGVLELAGGLFLHGLRPEALEAIRTIPELSVHLPANVNSAFLEERAAEHYHLFGMNVFPYASAFLDSSRMLGGPVAEAAQGFYLQGGFTPATTSEGPDHLGHELAFAAHLLRSGQDDLLRHFLHSHLLAWLPPLVQAVRRQGDGFYAALAGLSLSQAEASLGGSAPPEAAAFSLPSPPSNLLENPETRLRDIAEFLLTPAFAGIYLSRDRIAALGRHVGVPRGFGDRVQILSNLFHSGADYEALAGVFGLLEEEVQGWIEGYAEWEARPGLAPAVRIWQARARGTLEVVTRIISVI